VLHFPKSTLARRRAMISSDDADASGPPASRVGNDLRTARERLGWALPDVAAHLRIRLPFLDALEAGRTDELPGTAYALGFLRTYAQALGLDPDEMTRRFREEAAEANRKTELKFPAPVPDRGMPAGAVVLVGGLLLIAAYAGWYRVSDHGLTGADAVPPVPARLAPLAASPDQHLAAPAAATAEAPDATAQPAAAPTVVPPSRPDAPAAAPGTTRTATALSAVVASPNAAASGSTSAASAAAMTTAANAAPIATPNGAQHLMLRAKSDAWVQVRERDGAVLLNRVLRPGETWVVPDKPGLLLTTGNAGGTEVLVDGMVTASLGIDGGVRRDLPLDADAFKNGRVQQPVAAQANAAGSATAKKP
jgi:cytoskeleton protein RodZ